MNVIVWVLWCLGSSGGVECCDQDFIKWIIIIIIYGTFAKRTFLFKYS